MATQYAYNYAIIDTSTGMCIEVCSTSRNYDGTEGYIAIPEYSEDYLMKYYINGAWYEDAAGTIPWSPED